jgi:hypothetical protein
MAYTCHIYIYRERERDMVFITLVDGPMGPSPRQANQLTGPANPTLTLHWPIASTPRGPISRPRMWPCATHRPAQLYHFMIWVSHFATVLSHFANVLSHFTIVLSHFATVLSHFAMVLSHFFYFRQSFCYHTQSFCYSAQSFCDFLSHFVIFISHF